MVGDLRKVMKLNRHNSLFKSGRLEESLKEHQAIMAALLAKDPVATAARMREHFENGLSAASEQSMSVRGNYFVTHVPSFAQRYRRLLGGAELEIGSRRWRLITGYGHCPEHISLYCEALGVLISGDMLLPRITTNVSVQAYEPEGNPLALFLDSTARMLSLPADTLVLPSHGLPFRGARERASQLAEHHRLRLAELEAACDAPRSAADLVPVLFRRELDGHQMFFAMGESMAHLHYLLAQGRLLRLPPQDGVLRYVRP
jgi:glyoxylase-like metal-dependent hydrolase (beta-lactamase superfamily II)